MRAPADTRACQEAIRRRADAFCNLMREIYRCIAAGPPYASLPPMVATFEDGFRAHRIVDAILESAADGGAWTAVGEMKARVTCQGRDRFLIRRSLIVESLLIVETRLSICCPMGNQSSNQQSTINNQQEINNQRSIITNVRVTSVDIPGSGSRGCMKEFEPRFMRAAFSPPRYRS